jgi:hypothetical protein
MADASHSGPMEHPDVFESLILDFVEKYPGPRERSS